MKMLFYSADLTEVQQASSEFQHAGIPCEVRNSPKPRSRLEAPPCAELWIRDERDCHRALMLCVQLGIGFSRRPKRRDIFDEVSWTEAPEEAEVMEMD
jgi:hypothetical protein